MARIPDLCGTLTRYGNLWKSGRFASRFFEELKRLSETAEIRQVLRMPAEVAQWRRANQSILVTTRPAMDLTKADEDFILNFDNSDWSQEALLHICHRGYCQCGGRAQLSHIFFRILVLLHGSGMPETLLYRWKGFESGSCYFSRQ